MWDARAYAKAEQFIRRLKLYTRHRGLTIQQLRTLKGQALNGDLEGAEKGLRKLVKHD